MNTGTAARRTQETLSREHGWTDYDNVTVTRMIDGSGMFLYQSDVHHDGAKLYVSVMVTPAKFGAVELGPVDVRDDSFDSFARS